MMNTSTWTVSDVANYLKQIGLGQYSESFIENDISGSELPYLTDEYMYELGIKSVGHRIKLNCFIKTIKNVEYDFPPLKTEKEERDTIHPLPENVYQKLFIESLTNDDQFDSNDSKVECKICHQHFNPNVIDYHQKVCQDTFEKCKTEFARRRMNVTNEDIVDLLIGKVPKNAIKLEKCKFCGKKISPKLFQAHQRQCREKFLKNKDDQAESCSNEIENVPKSDFKQKHDELIQMIKSQKRGNKKSAEQQQEEPI